MSILTVEPPVSFEPADKGTRMCFRVDFPPEARVWDITIVRFSGGLFQDRNPTVPGLLRAPVFDAFLRRIRVTDAQRDETHDVSVNGVALWQFIRGKCGKRGARLSDPVRRVSLPDKAPEERRAYAGLTEWKSRYLDNIARRMRVDGYTDAEIEAELTSRAEVEAEVASRVREGAVALASLRARRDKFVAFVGVESIDLEWALHRNDRFDNMRVLVAYHWSRIERQK